MAERIFRGFLFFGPPDFFTDFLAGFFLLIFVGKSAQKNPPGKSPQKSSKIYTTKILRHISAEWPGQQLAARGGMREKGKCPTLGKPCVWEGAQVGFGEQGGSAKVLG